MKIIALIGALLLLAMCGGAPAPSPQQVQTALADAGALNVRAEPLEEGVPVPRSFTSRLVFELPSVAPKGGQLFACDTKKNCDAIYAYFDAMKALAGPYTYQSDSGLVVVQLNSGLTPDEAARMEQAIKGL